MSPVLRLANLLLQAEHELWVLGIILRTSALKSGPVDVECCSKFILQSMNLNPKFPWVQVISLPPLVKPPPAQFAMQM